MNNLNVFQTEKKKKNHLIHQVHFNHIFKKQCREPSHKIVSNVNDPLFNSSEVNLNH